MTVTPAPPTERDDLIAAWEQTSRAVLELGRSGSDRANHPTPCPGWDVFAQVAHVESLEAMFDGEPLPDLTIEERPHVRNDMGVTVEILIESRRHLSLAELCDQFERVIEQRLAFFRETPGETLVQSPFGMLPLTEFLSIRCFDIWTHEQDLREALDVPGNLDSPAASLSMARMFASLGRIAVAAGVPVGSSVVVALEGPVSGRAGVKVVEVDGKIRGRAVAEVGDEALCVLVLQTRDAGRLAAGRTPIRDEDAPTWTSFGDADTAAALVRHFAVTP